MACTQQSIYKWFDEFEAFCREHDITSEDQIYNCDESGFPLQTYKHKNNKISNIINNNQILKFSQEIKIREN